MPEFSTEFWVGTALSLTLAALAFAVTFAMEAKTKGEFRFAVSCFLISAGIIVYGIERWQMSSSWSAWPRIIVAYALLALVLILSGEAIRWAYHRHLSSSVASPHSPTTETHPLSDSVTATVQRKELKDEVSVKVEKKPESPKNSNPKEIPSEPSLTKQPDVSLAFVYPKSPALLILNSPAALARDIKWMVALWNMDLPDRNDPLPLPVSTFDWIRPGDNGGPQNLFNQPNVAPLVKDGDRLCGTASVICPTCDRGRTYFVYIVLGQGGWFSEVQAETSGHIIVPKNFLKETREQYYQQIQDSIPENARKPIEDWLPKN
jgi:hypothetical protein